MKVKSDQRKWQLKGSVSSSRKVSDLVDSNPIDSIIPDFEYQPIPEFTLEEVEKAMDSFDPKKSCGPDEIPQIVIKVCFEVLATYVQRLFNCIARTGVIPDSWGIVRVKPIHKRGDKDTEANLNLQPQYNQQVVRKMSLSLKLNVRSAYQKSNKIDVNVNMLGNPYRS
jgi:hypothetical protein